MARQSLGRGLGALISEGDRNETEPSSSEIDIDLIEPNPNQPRIRFAEENLKELAASIRVNGIIQPILVRKFGAKYQIVAGERRWRAAQRAELRRVPVVVREIPDNKMLEIALIENIQRHELNAIEEANAYRKLIDTIGLTHEQVADRVGKDRTFVTTTMRLLKLPADLQKHIVDGRLSLSHGRALLMTDDAELQRDVAATIIANGLSVRATENAIKRARKPGETGKAEISTRSVDPNVKMAETKLMRKLATNVKINSNGNGTRGKIEIEYYGIDDLDRIFQLIVV